MIRMLLKKIYYLKDLPKTLYLNLKALPFRQAIRLPIRCGSGVIFRGIKKGSIILDCPIKRGIVSIGVEPPRSFGLGGVKHKTSFLYISDGKLIFHGRCSLAAGNTINISKGGQLIIGENFSTNTLCNFFVQKKVIVGDDGFLGWNVSVRDNDGHPIINKDTRKVINTPKEIIIGDRVWLCSDVTILKGVSIASDSVVACNSVVAKPLLQPNSVYGGNPVHVLKQNIEFIK